MVYLGETRVSQKLTPYKNYTASDMAIVYIEKYGQIDGSHHKTWVLDQVSRILKGTKIIYKIAKWIKPDGYYEIEYRIETGKPSKKYLDWVKKMKGDLKDGEYEYSYDEGIAP